MDIQSLAAATAATAASGATPAEPDERTGLGQDDFLRMLITQLEHQDPLEPQDPTEFTAQLAQFSTLEQLMAIREGVDSLGKTTETTADLAALASLVGRDVVVRGDQFTLTTEGAPPPIELSLGADAAAVQVSLLDSAGGVVRSLDAGALGAGRHAIAWDGLREDGRPIPPGVYRIRAESRDGVNASQIDTLVRGRVRAVEPGVGGAGPSLEVGSLRIPAAEVVEVREARVGS